MMDTDVLEHDVLAEDDFDFEVAEPPEWMTAREYLELCAIEKLTSITRRPTFLMRYHWRDHKRLAQRGYITWKKRDRTMADVDVTDKGRQLVRETAP